MVYNYYKILGLETDAGIDAIKSSYRKLAFKYHPDRNPEEKAKEFFQLLNEAYATLSDDIKRADYRRRMNLASDSEILAASLQKRRSRRNQGSTTKPNSIVNEELHMPPKFTRYVLFSTGFLFGIFMIVFPIFDSIQNELSPALVFVFLGFILTVDSLAGLTGYRTLLFYELFRVIRNWFKVDLQEKQN